MAKQEDSEEHRAATEIFDPFSEAISLLDSYDLTNKTLDDVYQILSERIAALRKYERFSEECIDYVDYLQLVKNMVGVVPDSARLLAVKLESLEFVELFQQIWRSHIHDNLQQLWKNHFFFHSVYSLNSIMWEMSAVSTGFCERIVKVNLHSNILQYFTSDCFKSNAAVEDWKQLTLFRSLLANLLNVIWKISAAREPERQRNVIVWIENRSRDSGDKETFLFAVMFHSFLSTEQSTIECENDTIEQLIQLLYGSMNGEAFDNMKLPAAEILEAINKLAANDLNKERIVQAGALPHYVKLLQPDRPKEEQEEAAHGLWILGSKYERNIREEPVCMEGKMG